MLPLPIPTLTTLSTILFKLFIPNATFSPPVVSRDILDLPTAIFVPPVVKEDKLSYPKA